MPIDNSAALKEQIAMLKELCKVLQEKLDTAQINYAVAEGVCVCMCVSTYNCSGACYICAHVCVYCVIVYIP